MVNDELGNQLGISTIRGVFARAVAPACGGNHLQAMILLSYIAYCRGYQRMVFDSTKDHFTYQMSGT
ncbi:hypothetical protein J6590_064689 [Homalodisca vitripennis]|nr:hypothetical protein J6590_064689 [Homalodisca vitripennis]